MQIRTIWSTEGCDDGDMPWLKAAVDEYTIDSLGGTLPDDYKAALEDKDTRELIISIPEKAVRDLFTPPFILGKVE